MSDAQILFQAQWDISCSKFDFKTRQNFASFLDTLEALTQALARDDDARAQLGSNPSLWVDLRRLWCDLSKTQLTFWDGNEEEDEEEEDASHSDMSDKEKDLRVICTTLAKFTRNLVAGVPENQLKAYENEPEIRRLLHYHTSWTAMEDKESLKVARLLTQTLSNIVTSNEELMANLWETYMKLPEDQVVLIRLLQSPDPGTLLTVLIFICNCIHGSRKRSTMMCRMAVGCRVCITLLDDMLKLFDAEELTQGAQAFDVGYDVLTQLIEQGLVPDLYTKFAIPDEIITQHQTTLLKIVDSYLQSVQLNATSPATPRTIKIHKTLCPMLATCFFDLSRYAQRAIERALRPAVQSDNPLSDTDGESGSASAKRSSASSGTATATQPLLPPALPSELDVMLPKVCEALVLVAQCIVTITLEADQGDTYHNQPGSESDLKAFFNDTRSHSDDVGLVQSLIDLLRSLDLFLPRINFGRPITRPPASDAAAPSTSAAQPDVSGFQYLKRDLVRLLGILCHGSKAVQDHVRERGGIEVVMNLCVVDERNPCQSSFSFFVHWAWLFMCRAIAGPCNADLREHAIFTLHNLLRGNPENQAVVDSVKPTGEWDDEGVLRDSPGAVRR